MKKRITAKPFLPRFNSPIMELASIKALFENGDLVIAGGGGGVPVVATDEGVKGVPAVIDKDRSSALLADSIDADKLIILTAVDYVTYY